ncbi:MAG: DNA adenine methylase [Planctomycetia bacterium]|nr:DNA adenine methylase [Planctomycetia bacterium]
METQGIKYAGSKRLLLPEILQLVEETGAKTVWDAFSGSTRVSQALAKSGYRVVASDRASWSEVFGICYLKNRREPTAYASLLEHLNGVAPRDGWFTEHYGGEVDDTGNSTGTDGRKKPFQRANTRKLDGIREEIDRLDLSPVERAVALSSLMLALDEVDNTLGHFTSYLRKWAPRSYKPLWLRVPKLFVNTMEHDVFRADVFDLLETVQAEVAYLDPPYGSNNDKMPPSRVRYASYYHFWTTLIQNDRPELFGNVGRRKDSSDLVSASVFEEFRKNDAGKFLAVDAIRRLLAGVKTPWVILSYSSGGRATAEELREAIHENGTLVKIIKKDYRRNVMAEMHWTDAWVHDDEKQHQEFLFLIRKDKT